MGIWHQITTNHGNMTLNYQQTWEYDTIWPAIMGVWHQMTTKLGNMTPNGYQTWEYATKCGNMPLNVGIWHQMTTKHGNMTPNYHQADTKLTSLTCLLTTWLPRHYLLQPHPWHHLCANMTPCQLSSHHHLNYEHLNITSELSTSYFLLFSGSKTFDCKHNLFPLTALLLNTVFHIQLRK